MAAQSQDMPRFWRTLAPEQCGSRAQMLRILATPSHTSSYKYVWVYHVR